MTKTAGMKVLITNNVHENPEVEALFKLPLEEQVGTLEERSGEDEEWGSRWWVQTTRGRLDLSEQDVSPIPDLSPQPTSRGFLRRDFIDRYGSGCSIQESSLATEGALWFGVNEGEHFDMKTEPWNERAHGPRATGGRMHLTRGMAAALLPLLRHFAEFGELPLGEPGKKK